MNQNNNANNVSNGNYNQNGNFNQNSNPNYNYKNDPIDHFHHGHTLVIISFLQYQL